MIATPPPDRRHRGNRAERLARRYLCAQGLDFITANFRQRRGEIDLVMRDDDVIVFVEIRYRSSSTTVAPAVTVNRAKRQRLVTTALRFLQIHARYGDNPTRFDVLGICGPFSAPRFDWYRNAFTTDDI